MHACTPPEGFGYILARTLRDRECDDLAQSSICKGYTCTNMHGRIKLTHVYIEVPSGFVPSVHHHDPVASTVQVSCSRQNATEDLQCTEHVRHLQYNISRRSIGALIKHLRSLFDRELASTSKKRDRRALVVPTLTLVQHCALV